ncbi:MAG: hypothetical protein WC729_29190 [Sphingomonas sp.]|uniref:hypothetical protein n=1 Tax=Sphingomonas sp. TaxID=28214 RepID=UPI003561E0CF
MTTEYYETKCHCGAPLRIYPAALVRFLRTHLHRAACGHDCGLTPEARSEMVIWLTAHHPALLYPESATTPSAVTYDKDDATRRAEEARAEEEKVKRLEAKMRQIDDYLARRGEFA